MGSPVSPILAELIMDDVIEFVLLSVGSDVFFMYLYVDDILACVHESKVNVILDKFNSFHEDLCFTYESEIDCSIPFLDLLIVRSNDLMKCDLYSKPTASGRMLHYQSCHERKHKIAIVKNIKNKILKLSDVQFHDRNFRYFTDMLVKNGYPRRLINSIFFTSENNQDMRERADTEQVSIYKLSFVSGLTGKLMGLLNSDTLKIVAYYTNTVKSFFSRIKDPVSLSDQSSLVYKIDCKGCDSSYVGQTKQYLSNRMSQHRRDCISGKDSTALSDHFCRTGHDFDFDNPSILARENNLFKRLFKEMFYIRKVKKSVNFRSDIQSLSSIYSSLLDRL